MEVNETAKRYAHRADLSKIPARSLWNRTTHEGVPPSLAAGAPASAAAGS